MKNIIFLLAIPMFLIGCGGKNPSPTVNYHTITFHSNGGDAVPSQHVVDGELAVEPKDPSKETFLFAGWYTEDKLENYFSFSTKITKDYDLYARWEGEFEYKVTLEADDKLTLESTGGFFDQSDFTSRILLKSEYFEKYDLPYSKPYYEVLVNGAPVENFEIEQVIYATPVDYYVNITIPKEELGGNITIKTKPYCHYLTFTGAEANAKVSYNYTGDSGVSPRIYYSTSLDNPDWTKWENNTQVTLGLNKSIYVKNLDDEIGATDFNFITGGANEPKVASDGNIMSLLNYGQTYTCCFYYLFNECASLISPPVLPTLDVGIESYQGMFSECSSLKTAPILPATSLHLQSYISMFQGCSSLIDAPELPALTLDNSCYGLMFSGCTSLINPPELPALTLDNSCYGFMFSGCTSLINPPKLPALTLDISCYNYMFSGCTSLTIPPELPATTLRDFCYWEMFSGCTSLKIYNTYEFGTTKFFDCPSTAGLLNPVTDMFKDTGGDYTADPVEGESYYYTID